MSVLVAMLVVLDVVQALHKAPIVVAAAENMAVLADKLAEEYTAVAHRAVALGIE